MMFDDCSMAFKAYQSEFVVNEKRGDNEESRDQEERRLEDP